MRILHVVGARPNFMKAAPVFRALASHSCVNQILVHTGQHYDVNMSDVFFAHLGMPQPDVNLAVGSRSHAGQTAEVMQRLEPVVIEQKPDWVLVYGDVNSTMAAALVCAKLRVPVAHVEAGLRSRDRTMPEEINRLVTDCVCDLLFTPSADGDENLIREGVPAEKIHLVGNVMIDTLVALLPEAEHRWESDRFKIGGAEVAKQDYALVTLHRPSSVDESATLAGIVKALGEIAQRIPVLFPVHPRTRSRLDCLNLQSTISNLQLTEPLGYLDFLALERHARLVITDSGGVQEETTYLQVPCLTVRENTERPITITMGTNCLVGRDPEKLKWNATRILSGDVKKGTCPPLWDGQAARRIADFLVGGGF